MKVCPKCKCTFIRVNEYTTADGHSPWKDTDGTWYNGPAEKTIRKTCESCGYSETKQYKRGKKVV